MTYHGWIVMTLSHWWFTIWFERLIVGKWDLQIQSSIDGCLVNVYKNWLVVSIPLKNISQLGWLSHQPDKLYHWLYFTTSASLSALRTQTSLKTVNFSLASIQTFEPWSVVSIHGGTPSHHPFIDGLSIRNHPFGVPLFQETSTYVVIVNLNTGSSCAVL